MRRKLWLIGSVAVGAILWYSPTWPQAFGITSIEPPAGNVTAGDFTKAVVTAEVDGGRSSLDASNEPPGVTVTFAPSTQPPNDPTWESTMTVETLPEVAPGSYILIVVLRQGSAERTQDWTLHVNAPAPQPQPTPTVAPTGVTGPTGGTGPVVAPIDGGSTGPTGALLPAIPDERPFFDEDNIAAIPFEESAPQELVGPGRSRFVLAVNGPDGVSTDPALMITNALLALLLTLVILAPGTLFESTLEQNLVEVKGWFGWVRTAAGTTKRWLRKLARSWVGLALISVVIAVLYGFLSPDFGLDSASIALMLGIFGALLLVTAVKEGIVGYYISKQTKKKVYLRVFPGALLIGVICVAISRVANFEPGYLWALVAVVAFRGAVGKVQGKALAIASAALLLLGVAAWAALPQVREGLSGSDPSLALMILEALLVATFVASLEGLFFGLMPFRFLDGHKVLQWNRLVWAGIFALTVFAFLHLLLNPSSGYFGFSNEIPAVLVLGLFAGFSVFSVAFWAYFRFRRAPG